MKKILFLLLSLTLISQAFSQDEPSGLKRFAIFAGSNDGGEERVQLEYAETDAMSMYNVFSEIGGLASGDTIIVTDPAYDDISTAFENMKVLIEREKNNSRRTEFFFYYSGHSDDMGILPGGELYNYAKLREQINSMNTDVKIAVLDSCSSGSFTRLKGGIKKAPFLIDESVDTKGHAFLTSSSENEAAQESDSIEGSYFTHYLISALRGAADNTQDGTVTLNEAYSFASAETLARTTSSIAGAQHPSYSINLTGSGDLVLTDLREIVSSISIDKEIDGRIFFRDQSDRLVIEFRKRAGIPVSLSLPGGVYKVALETDKGLSSALITVQRGEIVLSNSQFESEERSFARSRGDQIPAETMDENNPGELSEPVSSELNETDTVEQSLEMKMKEIRSIINDKFSMDIDQKIEEAISEIDEIDEIDVVISETDEIDVERTDLEYHLFGFDFVPTRSSANDIRSLSLGFIGKPYEVNGLAVGFMNMTHADVNGGQIAVLSNYTGRDHNGFLLSSVYNIVSRDLWGLAASGVFNITNGSLNGIQASGIFNISSSKFIGLQLSGLFNIANDYGYGLQASGIFNVTSGLMNGMQASGIFNIADGHMNGIQASGIFNVADNFNGIQASLINVAKEVNGLQIGLININDDINGLPIGLLTISKNGIFDFGSWYESSGFLYTGLQSGSKNFYNFAYLAFPVEDQGAVIVKGVGVGARINLGKSLFIDIDGSVKNSSAGKDFGDALQNTFLQDQIYSTFPNVRLSGGLKMFKVISIFGGLSLDMHIPGFTIRSDYFHNSSEPWIIKNTDTGAAAVELHPNWFAGIKINL